MIRLCPLLLLALLSLWRKIAFLFLLLLPATASLDIPRDSTTKYRRQEIVANHGVVASDDGRCSKIGSEVLREGGHAVDAAVAVALCLGVVSPASSGIGGGAFMLVREANGEAKAIDMREVAPLRASKDMYGGNTTLKATGVLSIAVPGELAGLHKAWEKYGNLPWERLVMPAERFARNGFRISLYLKMQMNATSAGILADKGLREVFVSSNGSLLQAGDMVYNKKLADSLRRIAKQGVQAFYNGSLGLRLVEEVQKAGGILTMEDLRRYRVKINDPLSSNFEHLTILGMPPPSSGGAAMMLILNILAQYGVPSGVSGPLGIHRQIEAFKHAFAVRMNLGDPDFVNVTEVVSDMLSPEFAKKLKKAILDNMTFDPQYYGGKWNQIQDHGTSHVSIVDRERNAVSMTSTVNYYFGSRMLSPTTGIVLNNEMDDFSMPTNNTPANVPPPAPPNFVSPGKRPLSSMSPTIVLKNGKLKAVVGASGGGMIIAGTTEVFLNHFARGMDPLSSVLAPRLYHQLVPNVLNYENWTTPYNQHFEVPGDIRAFLEKRGHVLQGLSSGTICQFVVLQDLKAKVVGVSDPRKGGLPAGF
ncbi:hypothetical protein K2173_005167 [Erythroxylum novogranatense]|uniref:Glutathione hydrolase n=1 Tax=Erythroxylum novogranatense TaxID=1862640 RepID=A0AAV8TU07_9ROSI|nr:hypothetical protein K2173_005167 [Erythroxylum novogranatense]